MAHEATERTDPEALLAHVAWIRRLAARLVANGNEADDVAQETLHQALRRPPEDTSNPRGWLARVARRVAARMRRGHERRTAREQVVARAAAAASEPPADEALIRASLQRSVVDAVIRLAEPYRSAILLHYLDEMSTSAVAKQLGVPVETVRTRLKRGLAQLRETLAREVAIEHSDGRREQGLSALALLVVPMREAAIAGAAGATGAAIAGAITMSLALKWTAAAVVVVAAAVAVIHGTTGDSTKSPHARPSGAAAASTSVESSESGRAVAPTIAPASAPPTAPSRTAEPTPVASSPSPAAQMIRGVVRDADGTPVADALVAVESATAGGWLSSEGSLLRCSRALLRAVENVRLKDEPTCAHSGVDGRFELPAPAATSINLAALHREIGIIVRAGVPLDRGASADAPEIELRLVRGVILRGRVSDTDSAAVPNAHVCILSARGEHLEDLDVDAAGIYRSLPIPRSKAGLMAYAEGFQQEQLPPFAIAAGEREHVMDFRLARAELLSGRVVRTDRAPLSAAALGVKLEVFGCSSDPRALPAPKGAAAYGAQVEDDGKWRMPRSGRDGNELGWVGLFVGTSLLDAAPLVPGQPAPDLELDVAALATRLTNGALTLAVRAAADAAPVPVYNVTFVPMICTLSQGARAVRYLRSVDAADGRSTHRDLLAATWWITVKAPGFSSRTVAATATTAVPPPEVVIELARPSTRTVEGRVANESGQGVASCRISLLAADGCPIRTSMDVMPMTDVDGCFVLRDVPTGRLFVVAEPSSNGDGAGASRLGAAATTIEVSDEGAASVALTLHPAVRVVVTLKHDASAIEGPYSFRVRDELGALVRDDASITRWCEGFASDDAFELFLAPGRYSIEAFARGATPGRADVVARPGATVVIELVRR